MLGVNKKAAPGLGAAFFVLGCGVLAFVAHADTETLYAFWDLFLAL